MRAPSLRLALLLAGAGIIDGLNDCFDPASANYKCQEGTPNVYLTECNLTDEDVPGLGTCLDTIGRDYIKRLFIENNENLTTLPTDLFQGLPILLRLSLEANNLHDAPLGLFAGLTKLERLYLRHNHLTTLPEGLFDDLADLDKLLLHDNDLIALSPTIFDGLGKLIELHLESNQLTTLPNGLFSDLGSLEELYLRRNLELQCVPDTNALVDVELPGDCECTPAEAVQCNEGFECAGGSSGYTCGYNSCLDPDSSHYKCHQGTAIVSFLDCDLKDVDIPGVANCLDKIGRDSIERLHIDNNAKLTTLSADLFQGLDSLLRLTLTRNNLKALPAGVFDGLGKLERLWLRHNQLTDLPDGVFKDLGSLDILFLYDNELVVLQPGIFDGLDKLLELHLQTNQLTTLPEGLFNDLISLQELNFFKNRELQCVPCTNAVVDVQPTGDCECTPTEAVDCEEGSYCAPGPLGYTCGTTEIATQKVGGELHLSSH